MINISKFETYLDKKQIDSHAFKTVYGKEWERFRSEFDHLGEAAFDARKKFFLNNLRLQFPKEVKS